MIVFKIMLLVLLCLPILLLAMQLLSSTIDDVIKKAEAASHTQGDDGLRRRRSKRWR